MPCIWDMLSCETDIDYRVRLLGLEEGTWVLEVVDPERTRVRHTFKHEGIAGGLTAGIFRGVAGLRVGRLVDLFANNPHLAWARC